MKWKVEIQIHWIECISVDTLACRNEWKYAICMPSCEASVVISVTNGNDLQLSSKYLLYILEEMSTKSVTNIP